MHLLIFLDPEDKIRSPADADSVSCAQIPDPETHPILHEIVTKCMVHGPCDHHCKGPDGHCTKNFPKEFNEQTEFTTDGYPNLACPNNGREYIKMHGKTQNVYTNRDIVPYNPYLSAQYNCHINVEVCVSVKAIKYIHKYIYKGHDRTTLEVRDHDEIKEFLMHVTSLLSSHAGESFLSGYIRRSQMLCVCRSIFLMNISSHMMRPTVQKRS